jgi:formate-dependent nitrite reductase membrane component NrfD
MNEPQEDRLYDRIFPIVVGIAIFLLGIGAMSFRLLVVAVEAPKIFTVTTMVILGSVFVAIGLALFIFSSKISVAIAKHLASGRVP